MSTKPVSEDDAKPSAIQAAAPGAGGEMLPPSLEPSPKPRRWRILRWLGATLLVVLLTVFGLLFYVFGTQSGLRAAIALAERAAPEVLSVGVANGRILGRLHLEDLVVDLSTTGLKLGELDLDWSPAALFSGVLSVERLAVRDLDLTLTPDEDTAPLTLPDISIPLRFALGETSVDRLRIFDQGVAEPVFVLEHAALTASLAGSTLELATLELLLDQPQLSASAQGRAELAGDYPLALDLDWTLTRSPGVILTGTGKIGGDLARLDITHRLRGSAEVDLDVRVQDVLNRPAWEGTLAIIKIDLPDFQTDLPAVATSASLKTSGNLDEALVTGTLDARAPDLPDFGHLALVLDLLWKDNRLTIRSLDMTEQVSEARLQATGELDLGSEPGRFSVTGDWKRLRWPLSGELLVQSPQGKITASGSLSDFGYVLDAEAQGPDFPSAMLTLIGTGDLKQTRVETLQLDILDGRIDGQASVVFAPQLGWESSLNIVGIDPGSYAPDWPGRIDATLTSQGVLEAGGANLTAVIESLTGTLRGYPIAASGKVAMQDGITQLDGIEAESGPSRLRIDGRIAETLDLDFALVSPDLASVLPEAEGSLNADGTIRGPLDAPAITLDLRARAVALSGNGIAELSGNADIGLGTDGRFSIQLDGKNLVAGDLRWDRLTVRGDGTLPAHQLSVALTGDQLSTEVALSGALSAAGAYKGQLTTLDLTSSQAGAWRLQRAAPLSIAPPRIAAGPLCLRQAQGSGGCVEFEQTQTGRWSAGVDLDKLDFALLEEFLPETLTATGGARLKGRFTADGPTLTGSATAEIPKGVVSVDLGHGKRQTLDFSTTQLTLDANGGGLSARLDAPLAGLGGIQGALRLPGWRLDAPARPTQPLAGTLRAELRNLSSVANLIPDLTGLSGGVDADLTLGGTLTQPGVKGIARVQNVNFNVPLIALQVKDFNLSANALSMQRMDILGGATIGGGRLEISGDGRFGTDGSTVQMKIAGNRLKVADTPEYFVVVSPDIDVEASSTGASIRGAIGIPEARIRPKSVPAGTVSPSSDVVLKETEPQPAFPVSIDLRVVMGEDVTIDAFGVRGRLDGALAILRKPGRPVLGDGQLQITDGQYRLSSGFGLAAELGAPLKITQGRLIYAKNSIDNPGLLLQAERDGGDTTAGVRVLGTLRDPKLAFFSESDPGMTQAEITKYLVTGIPPTNNTSTKDAGLAVGTYVAPKIYMEYEAGLGDEANKIKLRYDLSRHIELQTETGESQGADIYFKFEN